MSAMESQKAAEDNNNNKKKNEANINEFGRFIELQTEMTIHPDPRNK